MTIKKLYSLLEVSGAYLFLCICVYEEGVPTHLVSDFLYIFLSWFTVIICLIYFVLMRTEIRVEKPGNRTMVY